MGSAPGWLVAPAFRPVPGDPSLRSGQALNVGATGILGRYLNIFTVEFRGREVIEFGLSKPDLRGRVREGVNSAPSQFPIGGKAREGWSEALEISRSGALRALQRARCLRSAEGLQAPGSGETPGPTVQSGWEKVRTEFGLRSGCVPPSMQG